MVQEFVICINNLSLLNSKLNNFENKLKYDKKLSFFGFKKKLNIDLTFNRNFQLFIKDSLLGFMLIEKNFNLMFSEHESSLASVGIGKAVLKVLKKNVLDFQKLYNLFVVINKSISIGRLNLISTEIETFERSYLLVLSQNSTFYIDFLNTLNNCLDKIKLL